MSRVSARRRWKRLVIATRIAAISILSVFSIRNEDQHPPRVVVTQGSLATDFTDARRLVGWSDAVFIGRVLAKISASERWPRYVETQYRVQVLEAIKGQQTDLVIVNQLGGYSKDGTLILAEGDPMLTPGKTYLFAGRGDPSGTDPKSRFTPVPGYGDVLINTQQQRDALREKMRKAHTEEIPYDANEGVRQS